MKSRNTHSASIRMGWIIFSLIFAGSSDAGTRGDLNGDGSVSVPDAVFALRVAVGLNPVTAAHLETADFDGNGKIDIRDAITLLRAAVGLAKLPPAPVTEPAKGVELRGDIAYEGGTRVDAPWLGVSFRIPDGWKAYLDTKAETFGMTATIRSGMAGIVEALAIAPEKLTVEMASRLVSGDLDLGGGVIFTPNEPPRIEGDLVRVAFRANVSSAQGGALLGTALGRVDPLGVGVIFLLAGPEKEMPYLESLLQTLLDSVRFTAPRRRNG